MRVQTRVAAYITNMGIKKCKLADKAGINLNRFSKIVNNHVEMTADEFETLCTIMEVSPTKFLDDPTKQTTA